MEVQVRRWSMVGKERCRSRRRNSSLKAVSCQEGSRRPGKYTLVQPYLRSSAIRGSCAVQ